jgi:hypothetical protein
MLVFLAYQVHIIADVTSRLLPITSEGLDGKPGRAISFMQEAFVAFYKNCETE